MRRLAERKHRDREGRFVTEGEDLLAAGRAAGAEPELLLTEAGAGLGGDEVERALLDGVSALGSGTRAIAVWEQRWAERPEALCVYLNGVRDPGQRRRDRARGGRAGRAERRARPGHRRPVLAEGRSREHGLGLRRCAGALRGQGHPGAARGDERPWRRLAAGDAARHALPRRRARGPLRRGRGGVRRDLDDPARRPAESLGVAAAAAIALERISSAAADGEL